MLQYTGQPSDASVFTGHSDGPGNGRSRAVVLFGGFRRFAEGNMSLWVHFGSLETMMFLLYSFCFLFLVQMRALSFLLLPLGLPATIMNTTLRNGKPK